MSHVRWQNFCSLKISLAQAFFIRCSLGIKTNRWYIQKAVAVDYSGCNERTHEGLSWLLWEIFPNEVNIVDVKWKAAYICDVWWHRQPGIKPDTDFTASDGHRFDVRVTNTSTDSYPILPYCGVPIMRNSVLLSFSLRLSFNIHERMSLT